MNPVTGNPLGFQPSHAVSPQDAFEVRERCPLPTVLLLPRVRGALTHAAHDPCTAPATHAQMFDADNSGTLDVDEFALVLEFLGLELSEQRLARLFAKFTKHEAGEMTRDEFVKMWIRVANVREQLMRRGRKLTKWVSPWTLGRRLERAVMEEERLVRRVHPPPPRQRHAHMSRSTLPPPASQTFPTPWACVGLLA